MKWQKKKINVSPSKRIYQSIIADYDLEKAICELIDNAIDSWKRSNIEEKLNIDVFLDYDQQIIRVQDNAGGVSEDDIHLIISPGESKTSSNDQTIGMFGVGSKRAVVALAEEIRFITRYKQEDTLSVEIDDSWLESESWDIPVFSTTDITEDTTIVELQRLRTKIFNKDYINLKKHLSLTYAQFLKNDKLLITISTQKSKIALKPKDFDEWSYPPGYPPQCCKGELKIENKLIFYEITAGLTKSRKNGEEKEELGEYGVYFYCNDRLISRACKSQEVGFQKKYAGPPHPQAALARIIVKLKGPSKLMPWNSSKSEINYRHPVYKGLQEQIFKLVEHYVKLSKRFSSGEGWGGNVFKYDTGKVETIRAKELNEITSHLPPLPRKRRLRYNEIIKKNNRIVAQQKPWVIGVYESIIATDQIFSSSLDQKNRICLIILDSNLEIAFKEYLVNESENSYSSQRLENIMKNRIEVHREMKNCNPAITDSDWSKINYYYSIRCELIHKRSSLTVRDEDIVGFKELSEKILTSLFDLDFSVA